MKEKKCEDARIRLQPGYRQALEYYHPYGGGSAKRVEKYNGTSEEGGRRIGQQKERGGRTEEEGGNGCGMPNRGLIGKDSLSAICEPKEGNRR